MKDKEIDWKTETQTKRKKCSFTKTYNVMK